MGEHKSVRLEKKQLDAISEMAEDGVADNESEALRNALDVGLHEYGYLNGGTQDTLLRQLTRRVGDAFGLLGILWLGVTFVYPIELRAFAIPIFLVALGLYGLDRLLAGFEPGVSKRLSNLQKSKS